VLTIWDGLLAELQNYARSDTQRELGAVLIGSRTPYGVDIHYWIKAPYTTATRGTLTFTHKTWEHIHQVKDRDHGRETIVGWFHTHPGFGTFISKEDLFIHANYFEAPFQIACVCDPVADKTAFFHWDNERNLCKLDVYLVRSATGDQWAEGPVPPVSAVAGPRGPGPHPRPAGERRLVWQTAAALVLAGGLLTGTTMAACLAPGLRAMEKRLVETADEVAHTAAAVESLQVDLRHAWAGVTEIPVARALSEAAEGLAFRAFVCHVIVPGETLELLAQRYLQDPENWTLIRDYNNLTSTSLEPGQVLLIPLWTTGGGQPEAPGQRR
jgi:proteasome lid subunit RPN8/RPN11